MKSLPVKILASAAALIALTLAVAPKIIGQGIEQATIDSLLELLPPEADSQLEIRRNEFQDGWFASTATIEFIYIPLGSDAIALSMEFAIDHGPLLQTPDGLAFGLAYARIVPGVRNELFDLTVAELEFPLPELYIDLIARFDQSLSVALHVDAIEYSSADGSFSFAGLEAALEVSPDQSARFTMDLGEIAATQTAENSNVLIAATQLTSTTARMNDILAASSAILTIPSISSSAPLPFTVTDIRLGWGLQASETHVGSSEVYQRLSVASIDSEVPLNAINWDSEVKQLNDELLREYYRLLSEIQGEYDGTSDAVSAELTELGQQLLLLTLQNPLEVNNLIELSSYGGEHSADLRAQWSGLEELDSVEEMDISAAIAALDVSLVISLDLEAMLRSPFAGVVDPYVQQGYFALDNGWVLVEASLKDSVLRVNGDELPLDQFF